MLICTSSHQKDFINQDANFYLIIHGQKGQTKKLYFKDAIISDKMDLYKQGAKTEVEFKSTDVAKVSFDNNIL